MEVTYPRTLTWSLEDHAAAMEAELAGHRIAGGWLLGESFGSQIVWRLVARKRFDAGGVILAGGFARHPMRWTVSLAERLVGDISLTLLTRILFGYAKLARFRHRHSPEMVSGIQEFIARRNGEGRAYWNGREVDINAPLRESAGQIAVAQFAAATGEDIPLSRLPAAAQDALRQFSGNGGPARILYSHATSRKDTGWVSDQRATKILAMEASANGRNDIVALIKMAMRMFDLKSDACDNSLDSRCDQPGVREAFAQIKREEALQRTAARF